MTTRYAEQETLQPSTGEMADGVFAEFTSLAREFGRNFTLDEARDRLSMSIAEALPTGQASIEAYNQKGTCALVLGLAERITHQHTEPTQDERQLLRNWMPMDAKAATDVFMVLADRIDRRPQLVTSLLEDVAAETLQEAKRLEHKQAAFAHQVAVLYETNPDAIDELRDAAPHFGFAKNFAIQPPAEKPTPANVQETSSESKPKLQILFEERDGKLAKAVVKIGLVGVATGVVAAGLASPAEAAVVPSSASISAGSSGAKAVATPERVAAAMEAADVPIRASHGDDTLPQSDAPTSISSVKDIADLKELAVESPEVAQQVLEQAAQQLGLKPSEETGISDLVAQQIGSADAAIASGDVSVSDPATHELAKITAQTLAKYDGAIEGVRGNPGSLLTAAVLATVDNATESPVAVGVVMSKLGGAAQEAGSDDGLADNQSKAVTVALGSAAASLQSPEAVSDLEASDIPITTSSGEDDPANNAEHASQSALDGNKQPKQKKHHNKHTSPEASQGRRFDELLDIVAKYEGGNNYNAYYGHGDNTRIKLTQMSMREVMAWQREYVNNGSASSAAGRYQFLLGTLQSLVNTHNIPLNAQFDKDMQDRLAVHLLEKRNLNGYLRGNISAREFAHNLSMEWASLPRVIGSHPEASYYAGDGLNHSFVSVDKIMNIVKDLRRGATNNSPEHESHGLFNTVGELPQARQVVTRAKSFTRMSDSELTAMCDSNSGDACFQRCGRLAARAWGRESSGYTSAIVQWEAMKAKGKAHIGKRNIPVGALLYYDYDGSQYGHVAVYLGNNKVMSNDVKDDSRGEGGVYIVDTKDLEGGEWNLKYLGWSAPVYSSPHVSSWHKAPRSSKPRHHSQSSAPMTPPIGSSSGSDTTPVAPTVPARPTEISSADVPESDVDLGDVMSSLLS